MKKPTAYYSKKDVFEFTRKTGGTGYEEDVYSTYLETLQIKPDLNKSEQKAEIYDIYNQIVEKNVSKNELLNYKKRSAEDFRHMNFFENFIGIEETNRLETVLRENNISLDILRGARAKEFGYDEFDSKDKKFTIKIEYATIDGSPVIVDISLTNNETKETIYKLGDRKEEIKQKVDTRGSILITAPSEEIKSRYKNAVCVFYREDIGEIVKYSVTTKTDKTYYQYKYTDNGYFVDKKIRWELE